MKISLPTIRFSILFPICSDIIIGFALHYDHHLKPVELAVVLCFWTLLSHIFCEWIEFIKEFKELKKFKSFTESILNEFAESNYLVTKIAGTIQQDLKFDKYIKTQNKKHLDFHMFLSEVKLNQFLSSHFIYSIENKEIRRIPAHYFIHGIWKELVNTSDSYHSLQLLNKKTIDVYINNEFRQNEEINRLHANLTQNRKISKLEEFQKLFVLDNDWIDLSTKDISEPRVKAYLEKWNAKFGQSTKAKLRLTRTQDAEGAIHSGPLEDIGIFDGILGIQSVVDNQERYFSADNIKIDFYFDNERVTKYRADFDSIFESASDIGDFFKLIQ